MSNDNASKCVKLQTNKGDIVIELNEKQAPVTVANFLQYVEQKFYDGLVFHRVIANFMIQGGGFDVDLADKPANPPIVNEASNGLKNDRGTLAMARTNDPNSATCQFFINHQDNDFLNYSSAAEPGYTVFAKVTDGLDVVDAIAAVKTSTQTATMRGGKTPMQDVPVEPVVIESARTE